MSETSDRSPAMIRYRNHRGEVAWRRIMPGRVWYGETQWHPGQRWLLHARDLDRQADRDFALADVLEWKDGP
jgi:hypothetical protein